MLQLELPNILWSINVLLWNSYPFFNDIPPKQLNNKVFHVLTYSPEYP